MTRRTTHSIRSSSSSIDTSLSNVAAALATKPGNLGDIDSLTFGYRYYPFISSRAASRSTTSIPSCASGRRTDFAYRRSLAAAVFLGFDFIF